MANTPAETPTATDPDRAPNIAAALLLRELGYDVDEGGPLYFVALAKFLMGASDAEKKQAETPQGLILVLRRRLDAKKNAEASRDRMSPTTMLGIGAAVLALILIVKKVGEDD